MVLSRGRALNTEVSCMNVERGQPEVGANANRAAVMKCLLCGGLQHRPVFEEFGVDILQCRECQHVFSSYAGEPHYDGFWGDEVGDGLPRVLRCGSR